MNRRTFAFAGLALLPATIPMLATHDATARRTKKNRKPKRKIVTRTFRNSRAIVMEDGGPASLYPSTIHVRALPKGHVLDVNLTLHDFSHDYPGDLDLLLVAPDGRAAIVMSDAGSLHSVDNLTIRLDDQAATPLPFTDALTSGSYRPANYNSSEDNEFPPSAPQDITTTGFAIFRGAEPNGRWKLYVVDDADSDDGLITGGWSLTIKARVTNRT